MSSTSTVEVARRDLGGRQADRVDALVAATVEELRANGYDGLTVRNAARRAGVAAATAYNWFGSKDHLVAEVFARRVDGLAQSRVDGGAGALARVSTAIREIADLVAGEPELAAASTTAVLARDPDVERLRQRIGTAFNARFHAALGDDATPGVLRALNLAWAGALLQAGMGVFPYAELGDRMHDVAALLVGGDRP